MKFNCRKSGQCCSNLRGILDSGDASFVTEYGYGKLPIINLHSVESMSMPLFDFEAARFKEWGEKYDIDSLIVPSKGCYDLSSNRFIITHYQMNAKACPFLESTGCKIYTEKRGFICRAFPLNKSRFLSTGTDTSTCFGNCPSLGKIEDDSDKGLYEMFGDDYLDIIEFDHINEWINTTIISLMKEEVIRPALNYPYDKLLKRITHSEHIDFMNFLVEKNIISSVEKLINGFDAQIHARERI